MERGLGCIEMLTLGEKDKVHIVEYVWSRCPWAGITAVVDVAFSDSVRTRECHDLPIPKAHPPENLPEVGCC
jgi:hypothetical protein